ncbi:hypothetical protein H072_7737 [Dactylellina haptotyla CBS 200.50]|uniref:Uncharacterized protein n=1 Tax=Dactylellina haptotyla (strain CBS 200.50) TaxID=1284197 RepID=S8ABJ8_DACHA|nr:hypothetical protein H072_7737 [Dactylellina haptotyla CBS 200.50]
MRKPTYIVFDEDYDAKDLVRKLGIVVDNVCRPLDDFAPGIPNNGKLEIMDEYLLEAKNEHKVKIKTRAIRGTKAELALASIFEFGVDWIQSESYELHSNHVVTYSIQLKPKAFEALIAIHSEEVTEIFRKPKSSGELYMLVGLKIAKDPMISRKAERTRELSAGVSTEGIVGLATGIPADVGVGASKTLSREVVLDSIVDNDRAFAGEYTKVVWKKRGLQLLPTGKISFKREIIQKGNANFANKKLAFADDDSEDSGTDAGGEETESEFSDFLI